MAEANIRPQGGMPHNVQVISAHRTPDLLFDNASSAAARGLEVIYFLYLTLNRHETPPQI